MRSEHHHLREAWICRGLRITLTPCLSYEPHTIAMPQGSQNRNTAMPTATVHRWIQKCRVVGHTWFVGHAVMIFLTPGDIVGQMRMEASRGRPTGKCSATVLVGHMTRGTSNDNANQHAPMPANGILPGDRDD